MAVVHEAYTNEAEWTYSFLFMKCGTILDSAIRIHESPIPIDYQLSCMGYYVIPGQCKKQDDFTVYYLRERKPGGNKTLETR